MTKPPSTASVPDDAPFALITGGNAGLGLATAKAMATKGYRVDITVRSDAKGREAVQAINSATGSGRVGYRLLDLGSLDAIGAFVDQMQSDTESIDVLLANAGIVTAKRTETADGFEMMFGVNHLGHFKLVNGLVDLVKAAAPSRIVIVASGAHKFAKQGIDFDDLQHEQSFKSMSVYGHSKLANILFTNELAKRLDGTGVTVNSVHPGAVRTRLGRDGDGGWLGEVAMRVVSPFFRSPEKGAQTSVFVATDPALQQTTGEYFADSKISERTDAAQDDAAAARLWEISEQLLAR